MRVVNTGARRQTAAAGTQKRWWTLAFNAKAKARPNFGLRGVGYYTSDVFLQKNAAYHGLIGWACVFTFVLTMFKSEAVGWVDGWRGGGSRELDEEAMMSWHSGANWFDAKPWNMSFKSGEGYKAGEPKPNPAEGAAPFHYPRPARP